MALLHTHLPEKPFAALLRDRATSVDLFTRQTLLFRQLTSDVLLFTHTAPSVSDEQAEQLAARDIRVIDGRVAGLEVTHTTWPDSD